MHQYKCITNNRQRVPDPRNRSAAVPEPKKGAKLRQGCTARIQLIVNSNNKTSSKPAKKASQPSLLAGGQVRNDRLCYRNESFAIHHAIDDCPTSTVIRELLKNAEENALLQQPPGRIEWFSEDISGVTKLGLFNQGPGMSADELNRLMDLASTGKTLGTDANYGQGAKISGLKASPHGLIYRSCCNGRVSQITLAAEKQAGADYPVYVKKRERVSDGTNESWQAVVDVTHLYRQRKDRPLDRDWTEVILLGRHADHDTVRELIPELRAKNWLLRLIHSRFYQFPDKIRVRHANALSGVQTGEYVLGLEKLTLKHAKRYEDVVAKHPRFGPVTIRFIRLRGNYGDDAAGLSRAKAMEANGVGSRGDHICLAWRQECYELHTGWSRLSGAFGVTFGSANIAVQILLPDDAPVRNNTYRDALINRDGEHQPVRIEEFADLVRDARPAWLVEYVEQEARKSMSQDGVTARLKAFLDGVQASGTDRPQVQPGGEEQGEMPCRLNGSGKGKGKVGGRHAYDPAATLHRPAQGRPLPAQCEGIPAVQFTSDPGLLEAMKGRAAMYRRGGNAVFLNPRHFIYEQNLQQLYVEVGSDADRHALARQIYDEEYAFEAGKLVILAWLFRGKPDWQDKDWEEALSMGAFSVHLASPELLEAARHRLHQRLNSSKVRAASQA